MHTILINMNSIHNDYGKQILKNCLYMGISA